MINTLQALRNLFFYPLIVAAGLTWAALLWWRWRRIHAMTDFWSAAIGAACSFTGLLAASALMLTDRRGFTVDSALLLTVGTGVLAIVLTTASVVLMYRLWHRNGET